MKRNLYYILGQILLVLLILISIGIWWFYFRAQPLMLRQVSFDALPGWSGANVAKSLETFQLSCRTFLKQNPDKYVGNKYFTLKAKDWYPACQAALTESPITAQSARDFFQKWFVPIEFTRNKLVKGLFTGYHMPILHGSRTKTKKYSVPIYGVPSDLVSIDLSQFNLKLKDKKLIGRIMGHKFLPYYTREEINKGAIKDKAPVLVWLDSHIERIILEIEGSGIVQLADGQQMYLGYAAQNGAPYTSIAKVLIDQGAMTKDEASMQSIKHYLHEHPEQVHNVLNQNKSFVFFEVLTQRAALGTQGVALTPGYSLAIDLTWIPLGAPLWLHTTRPDYSSSNPKPLQRLMIAQDTGGAIRGVVRGDIFWGSSERATYIAGHMKNSGHYWLLLPQHVQLKKQLLE